MVGGNHVPGRVQGGAVADRVRVRRLVVVPAQPLPHVGRGKLPALVRLFQTGFQAPLLLRAPDVQKELEDGDAALRQRMLPMVDRVVARAPHRLRDQPFDPDHQHVLVVRAVEDPHHPPRRHALVVAPKEVVGQLLGRGLLERPHPAPLRIDPAEDVLNGAVLAAGVYHLQHDEQRALPFRVQLGLEVLDAAALPRQLLHGVGLVLVRPGVGRVHGRQIEGGAGWNPVVGEGGISGGGFLHAALRFGWRAPEAGTVQCYAALRGSATCHRPGVAAFSPPALCHERSPTPPPVRRVCVFCGSSPGALPEYVDAARRLGALLAERGVGVVYGGASVGVMGALADAALAAGGEVTGVIPRALWEREVAHTGLSELQVVGSMHQRKARMTELSDAFVALPGGLGTLEELFEVWTWGQLGLHRKPLGLLDVAGFYGPLIEFLDHAVAQRFVGVVHRAMLAVEREPEALLERLQRFHPPPVEKWIDRTDT